MVFPKLKCPENLTTLDEARLGAVKLQTTCFLAVEKTQSPVASAAWSRNPMEANYIADVSVSLCIMALGVFGNSLVIASVARFEWLKKPTNYFVLLLAVFDLCSAGPIVITTITTTTMDKKLVNATTRYDRGRIT